MGEVFETRIVELVDKCLQASRIDQHSLSVALSDLAQCLSQRETDSDDWSSTAANKNRNHAHDHDHNRDPHKDQKAPSLDSSASHKECNDALEYTASALLRIEIVRTGSKFTETQLHMQQQIDDCLDRCGSCVSLFASLAYIRSASISLAQIKSIENSSSPCTCIISSCRVVRRLLLGYKTRRTEEEEEEYFSDETALMKLLKDYFFSYHGEKITPTPTSSNDTTADAISTTTNYNCEQSAKIEKQMLAFINSIIIVLPTQISNAFYSCQLKLPYWATRSNLHVQMIESAAAAAASVTDSELLCPGHDQKYYQDCFEQNKGIGMLYFTKLIEVLLRNGIACDVSTGLYQFWRASEKKIITPSSCCNISEHNFKKIITNQVIRSGTASVSSPRNCANLIRSSIKKIISEVDMYPTAITISSARDICREQCMPFLGIVGLEILSSSESNADAFVNLLVLSPSPNADSTEQKLIICCVIELLAASSCDPSSVDEVPKSRRRVKKGLILKYLVDVLDVWNDTLFINETDQVQQRHVTMFILAAMDFMQKDDDDAEQQMAIRGLVLGVTNRLKVSEEAVRFDGMTVAEKLAPLLGEDLKFDELDGLRDEDPQVAKKVAKPLSLPTIQEKQIKRKEKNKKRSPIEIDPDEEYASDESSSSGYDSTNESSDDCHSSDSSWGEEKMVDFDLSDNEDDLRPVAKPKYLVECLELLRSSEEDNEAKHMHEVALEEVASLVRAMPPDLHDMAALLTRELLHIENKYNLTSFAELRWEGLCALAACAPLAAVPCLQEDIFAEAAFEVRLDALEVMKYSSSELCGQVEVDKRRKNRAIGSKGVNVEKVSESIKTRRWGRGRRSYESVSNKFGDLAPLFFYPLIQGFTESKHNENLWGGENGGRLLSCLLISLSTFVESSGNHPGTSVIASDLLDLSWSFYQAQNPEVRLAVLISVATCLPYCSPDSLARLLCTERLPNHLQSIAVSDPHIDCRQLASRILGSFSQVTNMAVI